MKQILILMTLLFSRTIHTETDSIVKSVHTAQIHELSETDILALASKTAGPSDVISLKCLETAGSKYYVGLWHSLDIHAPASEVAAILENFDNYSDVFEGVEKAKIIKRMDAENTLIEYENKAPIFFVPNIHYQMEYKIFSIKHGKIFKYHLSNLLPQKSIIFSDGLILLKEVSGMTKFYELDFFNADWGIVEKVASSKIWPDSIKELVISDFELKIRSENSKVSSAEKKIKLKNLFDENVIETCIRNKSNALDFFKR